ncbi:MAG TPA: condensation domain-containing protein, partial [Pyrinomonadaceae bacterium]|nr:condensation domain-containing protein [Pyrinomonadaceae bacterium]
MSSAIITDIDNPNEIPRHETLIDLLRFRALELPNRLAFRFLVDGETEKEAVTYGDLEKQVKGYAAWLQMQVSAGDCVLLLYPPGLEYISAFLGCLYAGVVAVPAYPPRLNRNFSRLEKILKDAQPAAALTTPQILARVRPLISEQLGFGSLKWLASENGVSDMDDFWIEPEVNAETLAMLQYTSGSTNTPRGVMLSHGNLLHNSALLSYGFGYTAESRCLTWLPLYHDMGLIGGILQPLYGGFPCTIMSPHAYLQRPSRWLEAISTHRITLSGGPNFAYDLCARKITPEQMRNLDLSCWEVAFNGSEPIRQETLERFARKFAVCGFRREAFYPCYGLAESTLIVSGSKVGESPVVQTVSAKELEQNLIIPSAPGAGDAADHHPLVGSGCPLLDQRVAIVNHETLEQCSPSAVGEIWVKGKSVAKGYWHRLEETERTFNGYLGNDGPYLRTGDLGFLHDGELFVTGRIKDLIVIRGLNHYPQDIEQSIVHSNPALRADCGAAFAVEVKGEERLVVVHELEPRYREDNLDSVMDDIRQAVAENHELQLYAIILIKAGTISKTSSGKIQRHLCREKFLSNDLETLAEWWGDVVLDEPLPFPKTTGALRSIESANDQLSLLLATKLGVDFESINVNKPIARYGIDSLMAIELMHAIEAQTGFVLPIGSFLEEFSIHDLAVQVLARAKAEQELPLSRIASLSGEFGDYPLSPSQKGLFFLYQLAPESAAYNISAAVRITSELDVAALRDSFQKLVERHQALRTTFMESNGEPIQRVNEHDKICFLEQDAIDWRPEQLDEALSEFSHRPFDLENGPLLRVTLFKHSMNAHTLILCVHHIVADFWSIAVLMDELGILYKAHQNQIEVTLLPLELSYTDYALWHSAMLLGPTGERLWSYWSRQLAGELPTLDLSTDRSRPALQTYHGATHHFSLSADVTKKLHDLARSHNATLYMTLLAAFQVLLLRYTGQRDILVGSPTAGRSRVALSGLVGYFANTLVLRAQIAESESFVTLLGQVRQTVLDALEHQDYPLALLVERVQVARDPARSPLFQVMFS